MQNVILVTKLMGKELTKHLTASTQEGIEKHFIQEAKEVLLEIPSTSKTEEEAKARLLEYLEQFN
jgi:vacuolar-type H+-ATPase subunit F/Vma7